jgi:hypothetical protein
MPRKCATSVKPGLLQVERIEAFGKATIDRGEKIVGLLSIALVAPEAGEAGGGAQLKALRPLLSRGGHGLPEAFLCYPIVSTSCFTKNAFVAQKLCHIPTLLCCFAEGNGVFQC